MKILTVDKIREADAYTIKNEPIKSVDLMERAGTNCYRWIADRLQNDQKVMVYAGVGNNAGDGLVISRLLADNGYNVEVVILKFSNTFSDDFSINFERLMKQQKVKIQEAENKDQILVPGHDDLVVDAIFGSGLGRPVKGLPSEAIKIINDSCATVVAVDIPSGMYADNITDEKKGAVVHADYTLSLQLPKLAMMMPENENFTGEMVVIPIGLHPEFLRQVETDYHIINQDFGRLLPVRKKFAHKGDYGHALIMAGCYGKMGACVLAAKASLRTGAGLVTAQIPRKGYDIIQTAVPECMTILDNDREILANLPELTPYNAIAVGPGIGVANQTQKLLKLLIQQACQPMVLDADALNILSENKTWLSFLPPNTILTPHPGEFDRIAGKSDTGFHRLEKAKEFASRYAVFIVLKGAHTAICTPGGRVWFNSTGNPGMATAGSGDALTGIITALLAQKLKPFDAATVGVYLHGLAGDIAALKTGHEALIASDVIDALPDAFFELSDM
ncbi:MAG: NAD(P)H-hydrate dehydratase [Bacteroidales bacterium]|nr:NAD(P)H-hydrate dehydratase [Bacteroidales bacterium]